MSFQAKNAQVLGRQLEAQSLICTANLVAATSDLPSQVSIDNSTITATVITLDIDEPISKCYSVEVRNQATSAIVALAGAPDVSVANKISVTVNGTALTAVSVSVVYKVQE